MANNHITPFVAIALLLAMLLESPVGVQSIGVCYGNMGDNLPNPSAVVNLYKSNNIGAMRLYSPDLDALRALKGSNIQLILDVPINNLQSFASDPNSATSWVQTNVKAYSPGVSFKYITVGNEVIPGNSAQYVFPAMKNIQSALSAAGLGQVKVSTAVSSGVLGVSYPPSKGAFSSATQSTMQQIVRFLAQNNAPLLANVYPYFSYTGNKNSIHLDYALFTASGNVVNDDPYHYQNLFDAMVDSLYAALEKVGGSNVAIVVSESGWPSAGGDAATTGNAQTYNQNLIKHVGRGMPRRAGKAIETYIFAMFNEDKKAGAATERNFGLFYPNQQHVYPMNFG